MEVEQVTNRNEWNRNDVVRKVIDFEEVQTNQSQRQFALEHNIPQRRYNTGSNEKKHRFKSRCN